MTTTCCNRHSVANFDHMKMDMDTNLPVRIVNRVCAKCYQHWYGQEGSVHKYTRPEWDAWINQSFTT